MRRLGAPLSGGTGTFTWSIGPADYTATLSGPAAMASVQPEALTFRLSASSASFSQITQVLVWVYVGPGTLNEPVYDLLLGGSLFGLGLFLSDPSFGGLQAPHLAMKDPQSTISGVAPVPEPGTLAMAGLGLLTVARRLTRKPSADSGARAQDR